VTGGVSPPVIGSTDLAGPPGPPGPQWWQALNPPVYLISVLPALGIVVNAGFAPGLMAVLLPATLAVILLQHGINLLNDVSDWRLGADVDKLDSWVRFHAQDLKVAQLHGRLSLLAGAVLGLAVLVVAQRLWILLFAVPLVLLGYLYNAGARPLSYTRLGEWVTGLCYGPGVYGCLWLLIGARADARVDAGAVAAMLAFGALAMALLLSHQPPQIETDRAAGKNSFAVRYGVRWTRRGAVLLYCLFVLGFSSSLWLRPGHWIVPATFVLVAGVLGLGLRVPTPRTILGAAGWALLAALVVAQVDWG